MDSHTGGLFVVYATHPQCGGVKVANRLCSVSETKGGAAIWNLAGQHRRGEVPEGLIAVLWSFGLEVITFLLMIPLTTVCHTALAKCTSGAGLMEGEEHKG